MKKNVLFLLIVFSTLDLISQISKGSKMISLNGYYNKKNTVNADASSTTNIVNVNLLTLGSSIGYFMTDRIVAGFGIDFNEGTETRVSTLFLNNTLHSEVIKIKTKAFIPNLNFGYYHKVVNNLYLSIGIKFSYGNVKPDFSKQLILVQNFNTDSMYIEDTQIQNCSNKYKYFSVNLYPEITYFIFQKVGFCLGLGGIEYCSTDLEFENSNWILEFSPVNWRVGIKIAI